MFTISNFYALDGSISSKFDLTAKSLVTNSVVITRFLCYTIYTLYNTGQFVRTVVAGTVRRDSVSLIVKQSLNLSIKNSLSYEVCIFLEKIKVYDISFSICFAFNN